MSSADYDRWLPEAQKVESTANPLNIPFHIFLEEAAAAAAAVERRWEPRDGLPGFKSARARVPETMPGEVKSLILAVQDAQIRLLMLVDPAVVDFGARARFVLDELEHQLEYTLDDGVDEPADEQLAALKESHSQDKERSSKLALFLDGCAKLASGLRDRMVAADESFDPKLIDEAADLAQRLAVAVPRPADSKDKAQLATAVRNRLLTLLTRRISVIRKTGAHVFRHHPAIVREMTSAYERRRRAEARRAKQEKDDAPTS